MAFVEAGVGRYTVNISIDPVSSTQSTGCGYRVVLIWTSQSTLIAKILSLT